jgi:hypothetical protein
LAVRIGEFNLNCHKCSAETKINNGCEEDSSIPGVWKLDDWEFQRCPIKIITQQSIEYLKAYELFNRGFLPNPGGWLEQPVKFIEAMNIISAEIAKMKKEQTEAKASKGH